MSFEMINKKWLLVMILTMLLLESRAQLSSIIDTFPTSKLEFGIDQIKNNFDVTFTVKNISEDTIKLNKWIFGQSGFFKVYYINTNGDSVNMQCSITKPNYTQILGDKRLTFSLGPNESNRIKYKWIGCNPSELKRSKDTIIKVIISYTFREFHLNYAENKKLWFIGEVKSNLEFP